MPAHRVPRAGGDRTTVSQEGFEPTTKGLRVPCSTAELLARVKCSCFCEGASTARGLSRWFVRTCHPRRPFDRKTARSACPQRRRRCPQASVVLRGDLHQLPSAVGDACDDRLLRRLQPLSLNTTARPRTKASPCGPSAPTSIRPDPTSTPASIERITAGLWMFTCTRSADRSKAAQRGRPGSAIVWMTRRSATEMTDAVHIVPGGSPRLKQYRCLRRVSKARPFGRDPTSIRPSNASSEQRKTLTREAFRSDDTSRSCSVSTNTPATPGRSESERMYLLLRQSITSIALVAVCA